MACGPVMETIYELFDEVKTEPDRICEEDYPWEEMKMSTT